MREIPIFIASSVREFRQGRLELSPFLEMLNNVYKRMDAQLVWNRPETSPRVMNLGGSQLVFDDFIRKSEFFALIVGKSVGTYTRHEYEIALEQFRKSGKPKILPCFLADTSPEAQAFRAELQNAPIGVQFIDPYDNFDAVKNQLQFEIANYVVETAPQSDAESDMNRARERIRDKIRGLQAEIKRLQDEPTSPEIIAEITLNYAEIWRLVREYKVEPDALLAYLDFLWKQHLYDTAIEIGGWLENFYKLENPGNRAWAILKNRIGVCYHESNRHKQAERYFQDALQICRTLDDEELTAKACNNLGELYRFTNRTEEAEQHYREALEIYRPLASANPVTLAPHLAATCENLGILLYTTNRMEEAERRYREALEIRRYFASANPSAFEPNLAKTCYNVGLFEHNRGNTDAARKYFQEALSLYEKFPHLVKNAQNCRDKLAELQDA